MNDKNKELQNTVDTLKGKLKIYEKRQKAFKGNIAAFVYKVNEVYALHLNDQKFCELRPPTMASIFNKNGISQIEAQAKFKDVSGNPIKPDGAILAEKYFEEMANDARELIKILEQTIKTLEEENK